MTHPARRGAAILPPARPMSSRRCRLKDRALLAVAALQATMLLACGAPERLDHPHLVVAARAQDAQRMLADSHEPALRARAHLELAWLCLDRGHGCAALAAHAEAAVVFAEAMDLAQLTRAIALQGEADVGRRAEAWLALGRWSMDGAAETKLAPALAALAVESSLRLQGIDALAAQQALRQNADLVDRVLAAATPRARWRLRRWLPQGPEALELPRLRELDAARPRLQLLLAKRRASARAWTGLDAPMATTWPALDPTAAPVAELEPVETSDDGADFALPRCDVGIWAAVASAALPAGSFALVVESSAPLRLRASLGDREAVADTQRLDAGAHLLPLGAVGGGALRLELLLSRQGQEQTLRLAIEPMGATAPRPAVESAGNAASAAGAMDAHRPVWADAAIARVVTALAEAGADAAPVPGARRPAGGPSGAKPTADLRRPGLPTLLAALREGAEGDAALLDLRLDLRDDDVDARVARARLAREEGQAALATALLAPLRRRLEAGDAVLRRRADLRLELGWAALGDGLGDLAAAAALQAVRAQPNDCAVFAAAMDLAGATLERPALRSLLAAAPRCPHLATARAEVALTLGDRGSAQRELAAAAQRASQRQGAIERLRALRLLDDPEAEPESPPRAPPGEPSVANAALQAPAQARQRAQAHWRAAQRALARGAAAAAQPHLDALLLGPGVDADLRLRALSLGAKPPWLHERRDGAALAAENEEVEGGGASMAWLLNQEQVVLLPGGGALRRVHQVARVLDPEAAGRLGEVSVAADAVLELARTHTENGEILAPAHTPDKEARSLRGVVPGATVEFAEVQVVSADDPATGATRLPVFVFGSPEGPTLQSEFIVYAPPGVQPQLEASPAAPPPEETALSEGWRRLRYRMENIARWQPEPRANRPERQLPTVRVAVGADASMVVAQAEEVLAAHLQQRDPKLEAWVAKAKAAGDDPAAWRALVALLLRSVADGDSRGQPGSPDRAARDGKGDRAALLWHLARRAGVHACLWRVAPWTRDPPWRNADLDDYGLAAVTLQLRGPRGPVEVVYDPGVDGALPDVLRPGLRDRPALRLGCGGERQLRTPTLGAASDRRDIDIEVRWAEDGSVVAEGREQLRGVLAVAVRNLLNSGDPEARAAVLRQMTSASFPGMSPTWVEQRGLDSDEQVLDLRWRVEGPAEPSRREQLTLGLSPYRLGREYAALPRRTFPLRIGHELDVGLRLTILGGSGRIVGPEEVNIGAPGFSYTLIGQASAGRLRLEASLRVRMGVVAPSAYPAFAAAAQAADRAEVVHLQRSGAGAAQPRR